MSQIASDSSAAADDQPTGPQENEAVETTDAAEDERSEQTDAVDSFPLDLVFGILKNSRRRRVLQYLQEADGQASLGDVAEHIAAHENDKDVQQITSRERKRVYVGLYQCHLPKMDAMGIISFDKSRGTVELGEDVDIFFEYLDTTADPENPPLHTYSAGLSLLGASLLGTALVLRPLTTVPIVDVAVGIVIVSCLLCSGASLARWRSDEVDDESSHVG